MPTSVRWGEPSASRPLGTQDLDEFTKSVRKLDSDARRVLDQLEALSQEQRRLEEDLNTATKIHSEVLWANVERYKEKAVVVEVAAERVAAQQLAVLEQQFGSSPLPHQAIQIANARVTLAQAAYTAAMKRSEVATYVLKNIGSLAEPAAISALSSIQQRLRDNTLGQKQLDQKLGDIRGEAYETLRQWYVARLGRLDWLDFLYFSVGVSTTTTFGDIVPNSRPARIAVLTQLVVSVVIVGWLAHTRGHAYKGSGRESRILLDDNYDVLLDNYRSM